LKSALFSPIKLRELTLPNRIVVSPMCQYNSTNGSATDWHLMHLGSLSMGAAGLLMVEMTNVTLQGRISPRCAALCSDENEAALSRVVQFCRTYGVSKLGLQLAHAGRKGSQQPPAEGAKPLTPEQGAWETVGPSAVPFADGWPAPAELSKAAIEQLIEDHVAAIRRAERIGFDVVEVHSAHGYLLHQFLSPISNRRTDEFGGSLENRMRFPLATLKAMRAAWPASKPLGIRVSATDWVEGGWTLEETVVFARELKAIGCDYIDVSSGGLDPRQKIKLEPGYQVPFAARVREATGIVTMSVGLIDKVAQAEHIVSSGEADLVVLGRGALYDPRWAWHAAEELGEVTAYPPKYRVCQPALRPELFPNHKKAVT
jgi:2,4-dienoyl-CoA reductase-like NADH-dependent reductase (Old Yellow Enzyme family)